MTGVGISTTGVAAGALTALAVLVWPGMRSARGRRLAALGAVLSPEIPSAAGEPTTRCSIWHQDPVELYRAWRLRRRPDDLVGACLDLLDGVAPALSAGLAPGRALELSAASLLGGDALARLRDPGALTRRSGVRDLDRLVGELLATVDSVRPVSEVWARWALRSRSGELEFVAAAWRLSETSGAPLAAAVERAARGLRDARARRAKVSVAVAGPRATVTVLTLLPLAGPALGLASGIGPAELYLGSPVSTVSLALGLGLMMLGRSWCRRMIRRAVAG